MNRLTREQAAIIGAYTGYAAGPFADVQEYAERKLSRPIFTHEFVSRKVWDDLKEASRGDFVRISAREEDPT